MHRKKTTAMEQHAQLIEIDINRIIINFYLKY